jgi:hypothetical protein
MKNTCIIAAVLVGLFRGLYDKTAIEFFGWVAFTLGTIVVVLSIYDMKMLVENKKETDHIKFDLFFDFLFLILAGAYLTFDLISL